MISSSSDSQGINWHQAESMATVHNNFITALDVDRLADNDVVHYIKALDVCLESGKRNHHEIALSCWCDLKRRIYRSDLKEAKTILGQSKCGLNSYHDQEIGFPTAHEMVANGTTRVKI